MIENFTKGALPDPRDDRDYSAAIIMAASPSVDWEKGFILPKPPFWDQQSSDACVGASWSYYHWQLKNKNYSRRGLFSRIALSYGAYIRDGGLKICQIGQETNDEVADPDIRTATSMRDKTGVNDKEASDDREADSFVLPADIDSVAKAIRDYKGVVFGVIGTNEGWQNYADPRPPKDGETQWGHALYLYGYCMRNGKKCVIARSSWSEQDHYINEDYFKNPSFIFNPWTLIPRKEQNKMSKVFIKMGDKVGVLVAEGFTFGGGFAKDPESLEKLKQVFEFTGGEPTVEIPNN